MLFAGAATTIAFLPLYNLTWRVFSDRAEESWQVCYAYKQDKPSGVISVPSPAALALLGAGIVSFGVYAKN